MAYSLNNNSSANGVRNNYGNDNQNIPINNVPRHCLTNYIGLAGCGIDMPNSGAYLNELPGVSLKTIDNIADSEQTNFNGVWADIQSRSLRKFDTDVQNYLSKRYKLKTPLDTINLGKQVNTDYSVQTQPRNYNQGLHISIAYGSALQEIHLQEISLYTFDTYGMLPITIFERGDDGLYYTLDSFVIDVTANKWNTIYIDKSYNVKDLYITYTGNMYAMPQTLNNQSKNYTSCHLTVSGCEKNNDALTAPVDTENSFGMSAVVSTRCNWQAYVCNNKSLFTQSLLLLYGIELMNERIHSPRLNQYTLFGADKARQLRDELVVQYQQELDNVLSTISFGADCCVECNGQLTFKHRLP